MLSTVLIIVAVFLILRALYKWATIDNDFFEKRNIKYIKPTFFFGYDSDVYFTSKTLPEISMNLYNAFPNEPFNGVFHYRRPTLLIRHPEILKRICIKDFVHFEDRGQLSLQKSKQLFVNILALMENTRWRLMRPILSPSFTGSKMRIMYECLTDVANNGVEHLKNIAKNGEKINVEMKEFFSRCSSDMTASCVFGLKSNSIDDPNDPFYRTGLELTNIVNFRNLTKLKIMSFIPKVTQLLKIRFEGKHGNVFKDMVLDTIQMRKKNNIYRPDMINIMMQGIDGTLKHETSKEIDAFAAVEESEIGKVKANRVWSDDEVVAQCMLFLIAGSDGLSTPIAFTVYELIANPAVQQKLYEEIAAIDEHLGGKPISYNELQSLKYLDQVCSEVLRRWPGQLKFDRTCTKDYVYDDGNLKFKVEKGQAILVPLYGIHHDPEYFPDPERFDPERFSEANRDKIIPGTYMPFGLGPRSCIGSRFAIMVLKTTLYHFVLNFSFEPNEKSEIPLKCPKAVHGLYPTTGIHVELKPRNKHSIL